MNIQQFDYTVNLLQSILWQYNDATNLSGLIKSKQSWYNTNQTQFWTDWYNNVFNLLTANAFGISVWSYILNVPLYINNPPESPSKPIWGFNSGTYPTWNNSNVNFGNGNFSVRGTIISLTLEQQRFLLRLRYFQLTTRADITDINAFLNYLCNTSVTGYTGTIYALENQNMTITYHFTATNFPSGLLTVITKLDIFPRPAGVQLIITS